MWKKEYKEPIFIISGPYIKFISELELQITKTRLLLLTEIHLNLDYFDYIYCIPGCLVCKDVICLLCDKELVLKDG